jgi:hypothetical protein
MTGAERSCRQNWAALEYFTALHHMQSCDEMARTASLRAADAWHPMAMLAFRRLAKTMLADRERYAADAERAVKQWARHAGEVDALDRALAGVAARLEEERST